MNTFDETTIKSQLVLLKDWQFVNNAIEKHFQFKDFTQALGFIVQVGVLSEKRNHHPELLNVYNKVTRWVKLSKTSVRVFFVQLNETKNVSRTVFDVNFSCSRYNFLSKITRTDEKYTQKLISPNGLK